MSATRADPNGDAHTLGNADHGDARLRRRVHAEKQLEAVECVEVGEWRTGAVGEIVAQARRLAGSGTVGVFVNTVSMAIAAARQLEGTVALVCGRMRPADLEALRARWPGLLDARGNPEVDFLVTTQSLEVGVDLDLPAVVTAIAPASALAQRAGRLNRSGKHPGAKLVVVAPRDLDAADPDAVGKAFVPYDGEEVVAAAGWLAALEGDASPARIGATPPPPSQRPPLPSLTRVELETLALTGHTLAADPDVSFYVEEPHDRNEALVSIGARAHLDLAEEIVRQALRAAPPRAHELATVPTGNVLDAILGAASGSWLMRRERGAWSAEPVGDDPREVRPGDVVVVPAGSRICTAGVIGVVRKGAGEPIADVMAARPEGDTPDAIVKLRREAVEAVAADDRSLGGRAARRALATLVRDAGHRELADRLRDRRLGDLTVTWCADDEHEHGLLVVVATRREGRLPATRVTEAADPVTVDAHGQAVEARMAEILSRLDLGPQALGVEDAQLLAAARWHDEGKRHPRFQQRMGAAPDGSALAKPAPGHEADGGDGWRHEQLSAGFAWAHTSSDPVPTILVTGHHGHGLPLFDRDADELLGGWDGCDAAVAEAVRLLFGPSGRYELERARLQRTLGVHRLAYLEALLRCADMQVSREGR